MKQSEVFEKAIDVLYARGWHQGAFEGSDGAVCAAGALCAAVGGNSVNLLAPGWIGALGRLSSLHSNVPAWNDAPERTVEDVVMALKECAYQARLEEMSS